MRDFSSDLKERLAEVTGRLLDRHKRHARDMEALEAAYERDTDALERERGALRTVLEFEEQRASPGAVIGPKSKPTLPLFDFLITRLHAHGEMDKDELRAAADDAGYFDERMNGRAFHTILMNGVRNGKISQLPDGRYAYRPRQDLLSSTIHGSAMTQ